MDTRNKIPTPSSPEKHSQPESIPGAIAWNGIRISTTAITIVSFTTPATFFTNQAHLHNATAAPLAKPPALSWTKAMVYGLCSTTIRLGEYSRATFAHSMKASSIKSGLYANTRKNTGQPAETELSGEDTNTKPAVSNFFVNLADFGLISSLDLALTALPSNKVIIAGNKLPLPTTWRQTFDLGTAGIGLRAGRSILSFTGIAMTDYFATEFPLVPVVFPATASAVFTSTFGNAADLVLRRKLTSQTLTATHGFDYASTKTISTALFKEARLKAFTKGLLPASISAALVNIGVVVGTRLAENYTIPFAEESAEHMRKMSKNNPFNLFNNKAQQYAQDDIALGKQDNKISLTDLGW